MRTKNEFYSTLKVQRNLGSAEPTFTPTINKGKRTSSQASNSHGTKRVDHILEKGKEYQQRKYEQTRIKDLEQLGDPELTFKPKINNKRPPRHAV